MAVAPTNPAPVRSSRPAPAGRDVAPSRAAYTYVIANAGALQISDVVFWNKERITEIHKQSDCECACMLMAADGSIRRHAINSVNALIVVTSGPTLDAANAAGNLPRTPTGQPIYRVESALHDRSI
jgi:hypothetical protein